MLVIPDSKDEKIAPLLIFFDCSSSRIKGIKYRFLRNKLKCYKNWQEWYKYIQAETEKHFQNEVISGRQNILNKHRVINKLEIYLWKLTEENI